MSYFENMYGNIFLLFSAVSSAKAELTGLSILSHTHEAVDRWRTQTQQESIPVGCVPPACWPYPVVSHVSRGVLNTHPCGQTYIHLWTDTHL